MTMLQLQCIAEDHALSPCWCGASDKSDGLFAEHILTCSKVRGATLTYRHNVILSALNHALMRFGLLASVEPRFYEHPDGSAKRPDLTLFVQPPIAIDLTVSIDPDTAYKAKCEKHSAAVSARGHRFMPVVMSTYGEFHSSVDSFLRLAFDHLPIRTRHLAILQTKRAMSEAWLMGTAAVLRGTILRHLLREEHHLEA